MTWIKLDDNAVDHPKVASLTDKAFRWWVRGLSYASRYLTDGILPKVFWKRTPNGVRTELVSSRLWDWIDPNFIIHDYHHHQSLKEDVESEKERSRQNSKAYRDRRRAERRNVIANVSADASSNRQPPVIAESATQRTHTHTDYREQRTEGQQPPPRPLISGESNPKAWGKIHGEHVAGFCDWVCLPEFLFNEFCRKSGQDVADAYVRSWAVNIRAKFTGQAVGDNLKFWRERWSDSHPVNGAKREPDTAHMERLLAIERGERKR
jgi:hypothetical protein